MQLTKTLYSVTYSIFQIGQGLLLHPYQTVQELVEDRVFVWMALLPTGSLALVTVVWRFVVVPVVGHLFSCQTQLASVCAWLPLLSNIITFFCLYWQVLVLYLLFRFRSVFGS